MISSDEILSDSCPECGSRKTYLLNPMGAYKCEECNLVVDDDYWTNNEPELTLGNIPDDPLVEKQWQN